MAIHPERPRGLRASLARRGHGAEQESPLFLAVPRSERRKALTYRQLSKLFPPVNFPVIEMAARVSQTNIT